jgi:hypothetical protein
MKYAVILLIVLVLTSGCLNKPTVQNLMTDTLSITPIDCDQDAGCPRGWGCYHRLCYKKCAIDADCPSPTPDCVSPIDMEKNDTTRYCV